MKFGYARISTSQQSLESQIDHLQNVNCEKIFKDIGCGAHENHKGFEEMNNQLREGDIVAVTALDRLGRSNKKLLELIEEWNKKNIHLHILSHQIDTTTPQGKFMFSIMAALAEQERNIIRERVTRGIQTARARGRKGGRPRKVNEKEHKRLLKLYYEKNISVQEICEIYTISKPTLYNYVKRNK